MPSKLMLVRSARPTPLKKAAGHRVISARSSATIGEIRSVREQTAQIVHDDIDRQVLSSVLACASAALCDPLMSLVDTAFVGQLGVLPLAALGPNAALFNVVFFLGFGAIGVVATNQISSAHGAGDKAAAGRALITAIVASVAIGAVITGALLAAPVQALQLFQTNAEMMPYATTYCVIRTFGVIAAMVMIVFQSAFRAIEDMKTPFVIVLAAGLVNAVLDPILMWTFNMGIAGAAWATSASQVAGALLFVFFLYKRRHEFGLPEAWHEAAQKAQARVPLIAAPPPPSPSKSPVATSALAVTAPLYAVQSRVSLWGTLAALWTSLPWHDFVVTTVQLAARCALILSTWTFSSAVATNLGTCTIAAYQIMQQILQLQLSVCWAFLAVGQSMVSIAIARGEASADKSLVSSNSEPSMDAGAESPSWSKARLQGRMVGDRVIKFAIAVSCAMAAATWLLRGFLPTLFTADSRILALVDGSTLLMCLMLCISWNNAIEGVLMGSGDTQFVINIYPMCVFGFVAALAASVFMQGGLTGIWIALVTYYVGLVSLLSGRYWLTRFRKHI